MYRYLALIFLMISAPFLSVLAAEELGCSPAVMDAATPLPEIPDHIKHVLIWEPATDMVLFERGADEMMPPSSLTKIWTMHVVFDLIQKGQLSKDTVFKVSENAWRRIPEESRMFLEVNTEVPVEELIKGVVIQSGNDACVVLAEGISGSDAAFAAEMTRQAHAIGATSTHFTNSTGMPDPSHLSTAWDLARMAWHSLQNFPEEHALYYPQKEFTYNKIKQGNRNPLLYQNFGPDVVVEGLKTGRTDDGGYGLVGVVKTGGRRIIVVMNGAKSMKEREKVSTLLVNWALRTFEERTLFEAGQRIDETAVWGGTASRVSLVAGAPIRVTVPKMRAADLKGELTFETPVAAPIQAGQALGSLKVCGPQGPIEFPVVAGESVSAAGPVGWLAGVFKYLIWGDARDAAA